MKFAFIFSGQGSQSLKMMDNLLNLKIVQQTFEQASTLLKEDFLAYLNEETPDKINQTVVTQPLMLTAGYATFLAWMDYSNKILPNIMAGHSLGEWTALVASGVIKFSDALNLVKLRATLMQEAVPVGAGSMAAVLGLDDEVIIKTCDEVSKNLNKVVAAVNFNAIGQVVIAGDKLAVEEASVSLKTLGAKKVQVLPVSVPSHCTLMRGASNKLAEALEKVDFSSPQVPVLHNCDTKHYTSSKEIKEALVKQIYSPVKWVELIKKILTYTNNIVECGPGKVLSSLNRRIDPTIVSYNLNSLDSIEVLKSHVNSLSN